MIRKLLFKIALLVLFVSGALLLMFFFFPRPSLDPIYEAALIDKHRLLANGMPPRIIFVGGSSLAFGLDSKLVERQTGMRVVNMGLHAGLGLRYILSEIRPFISRGDVVVVSPEYEQFFDSAFDGGLDLAFVVMRFPESRKFLTSWKQYFSIVKNAPYALRISLFNLLSDSRFSASFAYCRAAFNENGDSVGHLNKKPPSRGLNRVGVGGKINHEAIAALNDLESYAANREARVLFAYPALEEVQYKLDEKEIKVLVGILGEEMKLPVLGVLQQYVFPAAYFYDSVYHLNAQGRAIRSQKLALALQEVLRQKD